MTKNVITLKICHFLVLGIRRGMNGLPWEFILLMINPEEVARLIFKATSNNSQFVTPAPYQVRGKLRRESSNVKNLWIPAFAGMTFLEVALSIQTLFTKFYQFEGWIKI